VLYRLSRNLTDEYNTVFKVLVINFLFVIVNLETRFYLSGLGLIPVLSIWKLWWTNQQWSIVFIWCWFTLLNIFSPVLHNYICLWCVTSQHNVSNHSPGFILVLLLGWTHSQNVWEVLNICKFSYFQCLCEELWLNDIKGALYALLIIGESRCLSNEQRWLLYLGCWEGDICLRRSEEQTNRTVEGH
jgi:hypothetical protein